jgi:hypothetical protein
MQGSDDATEYRSHVLDIYGAHLHVATNHEQWKALRGRVKKLPKQADSLGLTCIRTMVTPDDRHIPVLAFYVDALAHREDVVELVDTCAHEAAHGAGMLLDHIGQPYAGTPEHHAYLVGWLARWLFDAATA